MWWWCTLPGFHFNLILKRNVRNEWIQSCNYDIWYTWHMTCLSSSEVYSCQTNTCHWDSVIFDHGTVSKQCIFIMLKTIHCHVFIWIYAGKHNGNGKSSVPKWAPLGMSWTVRTFHSLSTDLIITTKSLHGWPLTGWFENKQDITHNALGRRERMAEWMLTPTHTCPPTGFEL